MSIYKFKSNSFFILNKIQKGFTLIELLVVIAIIGILASIAITQLSGATNKSKDNSVKSSFNGVYSLASIFYENNTTNPGSYVGLCTVGTYGGETGIGQNVLNALKVTTPTATTINSTLGTQGNWNHATCHSNATGWAIEAPLSDNSVSSTSMWCRDSNFAAKRTTSRLGANVVVCP